MNIAGFMLSSAARCPDVVALIDEGSELTFGELRERAMRLASKLIASGVQHGDVVALALDRSVMTVVAMHATLMCGAVYCPLDAKAPAERLATMLATLSPKIVLHDATQHDLAFAGQVPTLALGAEVTDLAHEDSRRAIAHLIDRTSSNDPCYIIFTSGSTGEPKGVTVSHGGVRNYIDWAVEFTALGTTDRIAGQAPFHFDNSVLDIYLAMATGATLDIFPSYLFAFPRRLTEYLAARAVTFLFWVPSALAMVASADAHALIRNSRLRHIVFAGEVMPPATLVEWMGMLPGARFSNLYGPTEVTVDCTCYEVPCDYAGARVPIGFPLPNTDVLVVNEQGRLCAVDEAGEILVRGAGVALGYWNRAALSAGAFIQNPLHDHFADRIYKTGDLGYRDATGCLHFIGRRDNQIKRRGYRIELGDVEHAVDAAIGLLASAVVFDATTDRLVLFAEANPAPTLLDVRKLLKDKLPAYMLPDAFIALENLPKNASGKIDRKALLKSLDTSNDK